MRHEEFFGPPLTANQMSFNMGFFDVTYPQDKLDTMQCIVTSNKESNHFNNDEGQTFFWLGSLKFGFLTCTTFNLCAFLMESIVSAVMKPNFW